MSEHEHLHIYDGEPLQEVKEKPGWREVTEGGIIVDAGNADLYHTGEWRTEKAIWIEKKCIQCMLCWMFCPDSAYLVADEKVVGIDYNRCKGCGVCAQECPVDAIAMKEET